MTFCFSRGNISLQSEEMSDVDSNAGARPERKQRTGRMGQLARRWDVVADRARKAGWAQSQIKMSSLAKLVGWKWHSSWAQDDLLSENLACDGTALTRARFIGPNTINTLCVILERALEMTSGGNQRLAREIMGEATDPRQTLADWQVPLDLPCRFMLLPGRLQLICRTEWNVRDLGDLVEFVNAKGIGWILKCRNLGNKTVAELEQFVNALKDRDRLTASKVLPLDDSGKGLSLGKALKAQLNRMSPANRKMIELCLGDGLSAADCAQHVGVSSALVGMVRKAFVQSARDWLGWFGCQDVDDALTKLRPSDSSPESEWIAVAVYLALEKRGDHRHSAIFGRATRDL